MIENLISVLLLLLSCLLSIRAILDLLEEASRCVYYCNDCLKSRFADNLYDMLQHVKLGHSDGSPVPEVVEKGDEDRSRETSRELGDCSNGSSSKHVPVQNTQNESAKCEVCGQESCTRCKKKPCQSELAEGNAEISGLAPKRDRQQCSQCGNSATRCNHMR